MTAYVRDSELMLKDFENAGMDVSSQSVKNVNWKRSVRAL